MNVFRNASTFLKIFQKCYNPCLLRHLKGYCTICISTKIRHLLHLLCSSYKELVLVKYLILLHIRYRFNLVAATSSMEDVDIKKAVSDMEKDQVLAQYRDDMLYYT